MKVTSAELTNIIKIAIKLIEFVEKKESHSGLRQAMGILRGWL